MSDKIHWSALPGEHWTTLPSFTRDELIHALLEHKGECADGVYLAAAAMLELDAVKMGEATAGGGAWTKVFPGIGEELEKNTRK